MKASVNSTIESGLLKEIDALRGREKRSTFIEHLVRLGLKVYKDVDRSDDDNVKDYLWSRSQDVWNCTYRKNQVCLNLKLLQACNRISQNPENVNAATLTLLIREAETLRRGKYKCAKKPNAWAHLMDKACAFWQLAQERAVLDCLHL